MDNKKKLTQYKKEVKEELKSILQWWINYAVDKEDGGFYGSIDNSNHPQLTGLKGVVLNSRVLWTFSAAYSQNPATSYKEMATRAFKYLLQHFRDKEYAGVFWSVDQKGHMKDGRKQVYGQAFCIYGMAAYYKVTQDKEALDFAKELYACIEKFSFDNNKGGYVEAFERDWKETGDLRLSDKDENEKKTMNTHLHIIEAYANLYTVWPDAGLKEKIKALLEYFDSYIINHKNNHLHLFMDENWNVRPSVISYGHDIEASWLLLECAELAGHDIYIDRFKKIAVELTEAALEGLDKDGGLWYEYDPGKDLLIQEKHSWPQAEAMVGFFNAFQLTGNNKYLAYSANSWSFIKDNICDKKNGEWFWGIYEDKTLMEKEKAGFWKCPYHSTRACMEIIKRVDALN